MIVSNVSIGNVSTGSTCWMPALLTKISMSPANGATASAMPLAAPVTNAVFQAIEARMDGASACKGVRVLRSGSGMNVTLRLAWRSPSGSSTHDYSSLSVSNAHS